MLGGELSFPEKLHCSSGTVSVVLEESTAAGLHQPGCHSGHTTSSAVVIWQGSLCCVGNGTKVPAHAGYTPTTELPAQPRALVRRGHSPLLQSERLWQVTDPCVSLRLPGRKDQGLWA